MKYLESDIREKNGLYRDMVGSDKQSYFKSPTCKHALLEVHENLFMSYLNL